MARRQLEQPMRDLRPGRAAPGEPPARARRRPAAAHARHLFLALLAAVACAGAGSAPGSGPGGGIVVEHEGSAAPWTGLAARRAPGDFKFLVVADRTGEHRDGVFEQAVGKIDLIQPAFVLSVGDLIEGYTEDRSQLEAEWDEVRGFVERLDMPLFYAAGNHDFSNEVMARYWRERFGPSFYHFRYEDVLFLVLNSELFGSADDPDAGVPGPDTQAAQMVFAREVLAAHRDARWTFVLLHRPLWDRPRVPEDWLAIESWLGGRPYTVFAGHFHRYTAHRRHDRRFITLATTGGRSRMRGVDRGEFDHVALVSMVGGEPVIANLMLDGIRDADARTEGTRARVSALERSLEGELLLGSGVRFRRGVARFAVRNDGDRAIEVEAVPAASRDLVPEAGAAARRVAPGAFARIEIPVAARTPVRYEELAPATVSWTLRGHRADGSPLEIAQRSWLLPEKRFGCPPAPADVAVDGRVDEWGRLPHALEGRPGQQGGSASLRFAVGHDADFLYLAARVRDPTPFFSGARIARDQDAISVVLDARPGPARDANVGFFRAHADGSLGELVFAWLLPVDAREDPVFSSFLPPLPDGTRRAARTTGDGYAAELAIPRAFLDGRHGEPWSEFRLDLSLQDFRADGSGHATHDWRPSRFGFGDAIPAPGAGTFTRVD